MKSTQRRQLKATMRVRSLLLLFFMGVFPTGGLDMGHRAMTMGESALRSTEPSGPGALRSMKSTRAGGGFRYLPQRRPRLMHSVLPDDLTIRSVARSMQVVRQGVVLSPFNDQVLARSVQLTRNPSSAFVHSTDIARGWDVVAWVG
eukprot:281100-Rhodomonas_salina.1